MAGGLEVKRTRTKKPRKPRFAPYALSPAQKAAVTRARNAAAKARANAARAAKAAATRARNAAIKAEVHARRVAAARKGVATRRAKARAAHALAEMQRAKAQDLRGQIAEDLYEDWLDAKQELWDATDGDYDYERYLEVLEDIADEADTAWQIAYGPAGAE